MKAVAGAILIHAGAVMAACGTLSQATIAHLSRGETWQPIHELYLMAFFTMVVGLPVLIWGLCERNR